MLSKLGYLKFELPRHLDLPENGLQVSEYSRHYLIERDCVYVKIPNDIKLCMVSIQEF